MKHDQRDPGVAEKNHTQNGAENDILLARTGERKVASMVVERAQSGRHQISMSGVQAPRPAPPAGLRVSSKPRQRWLANHANDGDVSQTPSNMA